MTSAGNILQNNALAALASKAPRGIVNAIQTASAKTGVDFAYLVQQAAAESGFNAGAKAKTSSATGLYQFIESTWMDMVKRHGHKYGISTDQDKQSLLNLRKDAKIASFMAAEFAGENEQYLRKHVGGQIGSTELYFAHFMGAGGAAGFLNELKSNPMATGADLFPREARANRGVFYDGKTGKPRSLQQIYNFFDRKFSVEGTGASKEQVQDQARVAPGAVRSYVPSVPSSASLFGQIPSLPDYASLLLDAPGRRDDSAQNGFFSSALYGKVGLSTSQLMLFSVLDH